MITYGALDRRANGVAHLLRDRGVEPGAIVGLAVERSIDMIAGLLGILKAGAAYLPLDPSFPPDRVAFMVKDAGVSVVITGGETARAQGSQGEEEDLRILAPLAPLRSPGSGSLAYVIYTSGSTGEPKGVMVSHHNVVRLFDAAASVYRFDARDVWTMFHSHAFDFSVWEIWGALLHGGRLVIVPYWVSRAPDAFSDLLVAERVTVLDQTPSAFRQLVRAWDAAPAAPLALRYVIFGGEALDPSDLRPILEHRRGDEGLEL